MDGSAPVIPATLRIPLMASGCAAAVVVTQVFNVQVVDSFAPTFMGHISAGLWLSAFEIVAVVCVARLVGVGIALGVMLAALGASFFVEDPAFVAGTIVSKVVLLAVAGLVFRFSRSRASLFAVGLAITAAMAVDVPAFMVIARFPGWEDRLLPETLIRLGLGAIVWAALVTAYLTRRRDET